MKIADVTEEQILWGASEIILRDADLAGVKAGIISYQESNERAMRRRQAVGLNYKKAEVCKRAAKYKVTHNQGELK